MRRTGFVVFLAVLASGCLPDRDNPHDPSIRPDAELSVSDWTPQGGACPSATPGTILNDLTFAPIAHCLVLDARLSRDPQQQRRGLAYYFEGGPLPDPPVKNTSGVLVLGNERFSMTLEETVEFSVRVRDDAGFEDVAIANFTPTDEAPVVAAKAGPTLPIGGYPWSPGTPFTVPLTAVGTDPDGDPLTYCWSLAGGASIGCSADPLPYPVTTSAQQIVLEVTATDGALESFPATTVIRVREPVLWTQNGGTLEWIDAPRLRYEHAGGVMSLMTPDVSGDLLFTATGSGGSNVQVNLHDRTTFAIEDSDLPFNNQNITPYLVVRYDAARNRLWLAGMQEETQSGMSGEFMGSATWIVDPIARTLTMERDIDTIVFEPVPAAIMQAGFVTRPMVALATTNGAAWITRTWSRTVYAVAPSDPDGAAYATVPLTGYASGLAERPGSTEMWIATSNPAGLLRVAPDGSVLQSVPVSSASLVGIAFVDGARAWTWVPERGFVLFDVDELIAPGGSLDTAALVVVPVIAPLDPGDGPSFHADPVAGSCHALVDASDESLVATVNGVLERYAGQAFVLGTVPAAGIFYLSDATGVARTRAPSVDPVVALPAVDVAIASYRWTDGTIWAGGSSSPLTGQFARFDTGGRLLESYGSYLDSTVEHPIPYIPSLGSGSGGISPEGTAFWALTGAAGIGIGGAKNVASFELGGSGALEGLERSGGLDQQLAPFLIPFSPTDAGASALAWAGSASGDKVKIFDAASAAPLDELDIALAGVIPSRSLWSNELYAIVVNGADLELVRISPALDVVPVFTLTDGAPIVSAASDAALDACWLHQSDGASASVTAFSAAGVPVHSTAVPLGTTDLVARGAHAVYVNAGGTITLYEFDPLVAGSPLVVPVATGAGSGFVR